MEIKIGDMVTANTHDGLVIGTVVAVGSALDWGYQIDEDMVRVRRADGTEREVVASAVRVDCPAEVWVKREDGWHIVGQYPNEAQATLIVTDYRSRGEVAEVRFAG